MAITREQADAIAVQLERVKAQLEAANAELVDSVLGSVSAFLDGLFDG